MNAAAKKPAKKGKDKAPSDKKYRIPAEGTWANAWKVAAVFAAIGTLGSLLGWSSMPARFAFSWLFAFFVFLTISLGSLFLAVVQHIAGAGWGIPVRRVSEFFGMGVPVFALLFVPVVLSSDTLYSWKSHVPHHDGAGHEEGTTDHEDAEPAADEEHHTRGDRSPSGETLIGASTAQAQDEDHHGDDEHGEGHDEAGHGEGHGNPWTHAQHNELLDAKAPYLNWMWFLIRAIVYFVAWCGIAWLYFDWSTRQDKSRDPKLTVRMRKASPAALVALGFTLTFAAFDWLMSLEPTWYSTIFGVYVFAGAAVSALALTIVVLLSLQNAGLLGNAINIHHYHDLGKWLFGFNVFWAYIGFSQMMLIWYAGIPEEAVYYQRRWTDGGWQAIGWFLIFGHFAAPFLFLMSRNVKRRLSLLGVGAAWMLFAHVVDIYWFVMPYAGDELALHWLDLATLMAVGGIYFTVVLTIMRRYALIPVGDPLLERSVHHEIVNA